MVNDNKIKNIILAVLVIGLVGMTIAYAGLTQQLNITDNKADVKTTWKVLFNSTVTATPTGTATVDTQPTVNGARTQISGLRATFKKPGDKVVMTFKIQNEGNIAAKGSSSNAIVIGTPQCSVSTSTPTAQQLSTFCNSILNYTVTKSDGTAFGPSTTLAAYSGSGNYPTVEGKLTVELPSSVTSEQMAPYLDHDITITGLTATFNFVQN